jgi:hypothetical protein
MVGKPETGDKTGFEDICLWHTVMTSEALQLYEPAIRYLTEIVHRRPWKWG